MPVGVNRHRDPGQHRQPRPPLPALQPLHCRPSHPGPVSQTARTDPAADPELPEQLTQAVTTSLTGRSRTGSRAGAREDWSHVRGVPAGRGLWLSWMGFAACRVIVFVAGLEIAEGRW
jgi:hypothetical protein